MGRWEEARWESAEPNPVSYTHLDVYKRQSGDSALYTPYLQAIGAATTGPAGETLSDAVAGAMAWCPITTMDSADAAYEWNMGQFSASGTRAAGTWTAAYSCLLYTSRCV